MISNVQAKTYSIYFLSRTALRDEYLDYLETHKNRNYEWKSKDNTKLDFFTNFDPKALISLYGTKLDNLRGWLTIVRTAAS